MSLVKKILGEAGGRDSAVVPFPPFSCGDDLYNPPEEEEAYEAYWDANIKPLYDTIEYRMLDRDDLVGCMELAAAGKIYAIDENDPEFFGYLKVPIEQWNAAVAELRRKFPE